MWPPDPLVMRALILTAPMVATIGLWMARRPSHATMTGMFLATAWQLPPLLLFNALAPEWGWWGFEAEGGLWWGVPVDLLIAWAFLWGAIPALLPRTIPPMLIGVAAFALDLLVIPLCRPTIALNGPSWLLGEAVCIATALMPGLALARWTAERRNLIGRAVLQGIGFGGLLMIALPAAILTASKRPTLDPLLQQPAGLIFIQLQVMLTFAGWGVSACQEFALRGGGTALPQDPTQRLVISGPYAYVSNPMQLSTAFVLFALGFMLQSGPVAGAGLMVVVFSAGLASWHEGLALTERFGAPYRIYRESVRTWFPRWRPWVPYQATLYYDRDCQFCATVARWVAARSPVALTMTPAQNHPRRDLTRLTYNPGDGSPEEEGVAAFARALEHIHLGFALFAFLLRLPGMIDFVQLVVDASGGGPRLVQREPSN